jgi:NAD(P)-dependent dehydrogenase (short-subunit alcohol dehydrogenase family)
MPQEIAMQGKICLVTGSTSGIGEVTALELARMGAEVIVVSRNPQKVDSTVQRIKNETASAKVHGFSADLSLQSEILKLAGQIREQFDQLHVLVNNAGGYFQKRQVTAEGRELTFALNHLNYFLLTQLLLDLIVATPGARIVNVSSDAHRGASINFDDLEFRKGYIGFRAYSQSKLANVLFTYRLARQLQDTPVTVNALHPGFVNTGFGLNNGGLIKAAMSVLQIFGKSQEEGARTSIYLASSPEVAGLTGMYFTDEKPVRSAPISYDKEIQEKLWQVSLDMLQVSQPVV